MEEEFDESITIDQDLFLEEVSEFIGIDSEPVELESDPLETESEPMEIKSEPVEIKSEPIDHDTNMIEVKKEPFDESLEEFSEDEAKTEAMKKILDSWNEKSTESEKDIFDKVDLFPKLSEEKNSESKEIFRVPAEHDYSMHYLDQLVKTLKNGYKCRICCFVSKNREAVHSHLNSAHDVEHELKEDFTCGFCKRTIANFKYKEHYKLCEDFHKFVAKLKRGFKCKVCSLKSFSYDDLLKHLKSEHPDLANGTQCPHCFKKFELRVTLKHHITKFHSLKKAPRDIVQCKHCGIKLTKRNFMNHFSICGLYHEHFEELPGQLYQCLICSKKFPTKNQMYYHLRVQEKLEEMKYERLLHEWKKEKEEIVPENVHKRPLSDLKNGNYKPRPKSKTKPKVIQSKSPEADYVTLELNELKKYNLNKEEKPLKNEKSEKIKNILGIKTEEDKITASVFTCKMCSEKYATLDFMKEHIKMEHNISF